MNSSVICPRCGQELSTIWYYRRDHKPLCDQIPTPDELVDEFFKTEMTIVEFAVSYGVGDRWMRKRLKLSVNYVNARKRKNQLRRERQKAKRAIIIDRQRGACQCGMMLDHPAAQPVVNGKCAYCHAEENGHGFRDENPYRWQPERLLFETW